MNSVNLGGRVTKEMNVREINTGGEPKSVVNYRIAIDGGKNNAGEKITTFVPCVAWEKTAQAINGFLTKVGTEGKGWFVNIEGRLTTRKQTVRAKNSEGAYEDVVDAEGNKVEKEVTEVLVFRHQFISPPRNEGDSTNSGQQPSRPAAQPQQQEEEEFDLPF